MFNIFFNFFTSLDTYSIHKREKLDSLKFSFEFMSTSCIVIETWLVTVCTRLKTMQPSLLPSHWVSGMRWEPWSCTTHKNKTGKHSGVCCCRHFLWWWASEGNTIKASPVCVTQLATLQLLHTHYTHQSYWVGNMKTLPLVFQQQLQILWCTPKKQKNTNQK